MIAVFNPYFLSCFAFKYDSPAMALSILFPLVPFLFVHAARLYTVSSFVCTLGMYMTYQSSSGIYIMMVIFVALLKYITKEWSLSESVKFCAKSALVFIFASALFMGFSRFFNSAANRSTEMAIGSNIAYNVATYIKNFAREFNVVWKVLSALVAIAAGAAVCSLSKRKKPVALALFALALALTLILSFGGYIFLEEYPANARYRYGAGMWLAILASVAALPKRKLLAVPPLLLAWGFFSYASAFGNAHANQMKMEMQYEALVREDINTFFPREKYPTLELGFSGQMPWSGEVKNLVKAYPITKELVMKRYGPSYFVAGKTMEYFDSTLATSDTPAAPPEELTLLISRRYYNILLEEGTGRIIVECTMSD